MFGPASEHQPCTAATVGLVESCSFAQGRREGSDPVQRQLVSHTRSPLAVPSLRRGGPVEAVAGAERGPLGVEQEVTLGRRGRGGRRRSRAQLVTGRG